MASLILGVAITGMFALWIGLFNRFSRAREIAEAGELARAELERAKSFGADNLPMGTYVSASASGSWTGAFDPTSGSGTWTSGLTSYYDRYGNRLSGSTSAGVTFSLQGTFTDSDVASVSGGSYVLSLNSQRTFQVTVRTTANGTVAFSAGTVLTKGGL